MSLGLLLLLLLGLGAFAFVAGRQRALAAVKGDARGLHSLPGYYGQTVALFTLVPSLLFTLVWLLIQPVLIERTVTAMILPEDIAEGSTRELVMSDVRRIAEGMGTLLESGSVSDGELAALAGQPDALMARLGEMGVALAAEIRPHIAEAALEYRAETAFGRTIMGVGALGLAVLGLLLSLWRLSPEFRARNVVERFVNVLLIAASSIAILTTAGIIFSLVFETYRNVFKQV